jgi:transposase InsO family protein
MTAPVAAEPRERTGPMGPRGNEVWAMDFVHDQLATGRKIGVLTVVDTFSHFSPAVDPGFGHCGENRVKTLELACKTIGYETAIRVDRSSEFVSRDLDSVGRAKGVTLDLSRPGKPTDNAYIAAFNGRFRAECLNVHSFLTLADVAEKDGGLAQMLQRGPPARFDGQQTAAFAYRRLIGGRPFCATRFRQTEIDGLTNILSHYFNDIRVRRSMQAGAPSLLQGTKI